MLVKILSDLHIHSSNPFKYIDHGEYVCILAGDISVGMAGVNWALANIPKHIRTLYVPGNHEYYGYDVLELNKNFEEFNKSDRHVVVLNNKTVEVSGKRFVGTTLWTDFQLYNDPLSPFVWYNGLNDSFYIKYGGAGVTSRDYINMNEESLKFLEGAEGDVLITHYGPEFSESDQWKGHRLTPGFLTKIPETIYSKFKLHVHGHTHSNFDYLTHHNTRVICNPKGYSMENSGFNQELIVNI